jgi:hypothetical protein
MLKTHQVRTEHGPLVLILTPGDEAICDSCDCCISIERAEQSIAHFRAAYCEDCALDVIEANPETFS